MRNERGFTLVELLVAVAVLAIVLTAVLSLQDSAQYSYLFMAGRVDAQQNARIAIDRLTRELRTGGRLPGAVGPAFVAAAGCDVGTPDITVIYINDQTPAQEVTVRYWLNGASLQRNQTTPIPAVAQPEVLIGGVQGLTFTCFDQFGAPTAVLAQIRTVNIVLTTRMEDNVAAGSAANQTATVQDRVRLRNL